MSSTVIFKQSYKARASPGTAGLNVRHLQYIATRPGTVFNRGCGFGLWGQLPGDGSIRIQTDLEQAKRAVREASADHTLYRAILSVGKKDAQAYGLYSRDRWERLVDDHIRDIAKEMEIKPEAMHWCASFHCAKGHPHVHILYWDSSDTPRQEFIPKPLWDAKAEHIRAAFAGDIHRDQIRDVQKAQREQLAPLRAAVQAMCREANPEKALDLPRLYSSAALNGLSRKLGELIRDIPIKGSLRYAYLPPDYKAMVDALVEECLKMPELSKELEKFDRCTQEISRLYANGGDSTQQNFKKAREKLRKELGNQVMDAIREVQQAVRAAAPSEPGRVRELLNEAVSSVTPGLESYQSLKALLPPERIPTACMQRQIPGYSAQLNRVVGDVLADARVRLRLQGYALKAAEQVASEENADEPEIYRLLGKPVAEREWATYQVAFRDARQALRDAVTEQVRQDAGWTDEAIQTGTAMLLLNMMRIASQAAYQRQAGAVQARNGLKTRSKDRSREAKLDYRKTREYGSGQWSDGYPNGYPE